jgi:uracil-DNA glycosylase family 4
MVLQSQTQELLELVHETRKHLKYLEELGVEGIQKHDNDIIRVVKHEQSTNSARSLASGKQTLARGRASSIDQVTKEQTSKDGSTSLFGDLTPQPARLAPSTETFEEIWLEVGDCTRCPLHQGRTNVVHTEGNRKARLMFVGEAPGADEDAQARPFVGRAGQLLTKIIEAIGLKREEVLIGNVNRCRPPANRPPTPEEASMCKPFLLREIALVQPEVIVVMGNTAMRNLLDIKEGITKLRGKFQDYKGIKVMPTFHPAYLLRDPSKKRETWEDLKKVREYLDHSANKRA